VVRKGGRILLFGMNANASAEVRQFDVTRDELTVFGSYVGVNTFPKATRILEQGVVDLSPMITHRVPLEELPTAVEAIRSGRAVKAVVELGDAPA
jgi:(R,R)-butanediol dehydrogenase/meso-butanediol dehydrogenase/diacetyl reductase